MTNTQKKIASLLDDIVMLAKICSPLVILMMFSYFPKANAFTFNPKIGHAKIEIPFKKVAKPNMVKQPVTKVDVDYKKLAKAISCAETSCGRDGTAIHRNNCCGVMKFWIDENGVRQRSPKYYKKYDDSLEEVAAIWEKHYVHFPDATLAKKWTGNDHADTWLNNVVVAYNR